MIFLFISLNILVILQDQAKQVLEDAKKSVDLNHARCNFVRKPMNVYHLYRRVEESDSFTYWSMLSPAEWLRGSIESFDRQYSPC